MKLWECDINKKYKDNIGLVWEAIHHHSGEHYFWQSDDSSIDDTSLMPYDEVLKMDLTEYNIKKLYAYSHNERIEFYKRSLLHVYSNGDRLDRAPEYDIEYPVK